MLVSTRGGAAATTKGGGGDSHRERPGREGGRVKARPGSALGVGSVPRRTRSQPFARRQGTLASIRSTRAPRWPVREALASKCGRRVRLSNSALG